MNRFDALTRLAAQRTNRRQAGIFGALLLAALATPEQATGRRRRKKGKSRGNESRGNPGRGLGNSPDEHISCGDVICGPGTYCCNPTCSRCVELGRGCTREMCEPHPPGGEI